ncbi:MAG: hypothetical protein AUJ12_00985 [Alphaproteobacteria bacterium CG1_02_46_17]|nr:MAG: hypothetical protein AUJ12_00985 [Alphaproteobacteria bacterium CG1_02_46_17]
MIKSYAAFLDSPKSPFRAMEVSFDLTELDIQKKIAAYVNEKRLTPLPVGATNYMVVTTETPQLAANFAKSFGLVYLSVEQMRAKRLDEINAKNTKADFGKGWEEMARGFDSFSELFGGPRR